MRNGAATLARAVASIRAQTFSNWELIVVDDGSTDGTREILRELASREPRMKVIEGEHAGVAAAANAGAAGARGEFVARMDADDVSHPERLAEQVAFLDAATNRDIGVVGCLVEFGGDRAVGEGYARHVDWVNSLVTPDEIALHRFAESPLANPSVMFRRALMAQHGGYRDGVPTPIYKDGHVYIASGYGVGCKLVKLGAGGEATEVYKNNVMENHHGGVILVGEHLYGRSEKGGWTCQDFKTGESASTFSDLGKGAIHHADGLFYLLSESNGKADAQVMLMEASPKGWNKKGEFALTPQTTQRSQSGRVWTHPVVSDGKLYLRDQELLFCFDVKGK